MARHYIPHLPEFYKGYVQLSPDLPVLEALRENGGLLVPTLREDFARIGNRVYAEGKWTIPVLLQHVIDTERIMAYRALTFARKDKTALPGFDENVYADTTLNTSRTVTELLDELRAVRNATIYLFESFDEEMLNEYGTANGKDISVVALGYIIAGHMAHHLNIIRERYMPLLNAASLN